MPSRRTVLASGATLGLSLLAGCTGLLGGDATDTPAATGTETRAGGTETQTAPETPMSTRPSPLAIATSGSLDEQMARLAALWNGNPQPTVGEYNRTVADDLGGDVGFADHFARRHGFAATETPHDPPFRLSVGRGPRVETVDALGAGTVGLVGLGSEAYGPVDEDVAIPTEFARHDLFRTGEALVVSEAVHDGGVTALTREEVLAIYGGEVLNWAAVGGPDREVHLVTTPDGQPSRPFDRRFLRDVDGIPADLVTGRPDRRVRLARDRDDVLTRIPVPDLDTLRDGGEGYRILDIAVDGRSRGPGGRGYPGTYPIPLFTVGDPGPRVAAVLDALTTPTVQAWLLGETLGARGEESLSVFPAESPPGY
jgi:phosphate transport system substrate-binding protein